MTRPRDIADSINRINSSAADATAVTIDSSENVGVGITSSLQKFTVANTSSGIVGRFTNNVNQTLDLGVVSGSGSAGGVYYDNANSGYHDFRVGNTSKMRLDASGNVGLGTTTITSGAGWTPKVKASSASSPAILVENTSSGNQQVSVGSSGGGYIDVGGHSAGTSNFVAFRTASANSSYSMTERVRISSSGDLFVAKTSQNFDVDGMELRSDGVATVTTSNNCPLFLNRRSNDGELIRFYQSGTEEGNISVSGTTVSYNGGHLSRWSQLTDGTKDTSILKGTVMTNLDQMAVWSHDAVAATYYVDGDELPEGVSVGDEKTPAKDAYTEENEQLNCMAVSSVEGDTNVAGVFVNWDNDDDFNDMNIAMTGDMVIRIAQGTTVARGDLLMSAGDGTAKPQGDDIVRSKTIAKVTSTNVSHTYDDGSYLVPCVLMAC